MFEQTIEALLRLGLNLIVVDRFSIGRFFYPESSEEQ